MKHQMLSFQNIETKSAVHWCNSVGDSYRETTAVQFNQDGCYNFRTKPNQKLPIAKPVSGSAAHVRAHWPSFLLVTVGGSAEGAEQQPFQSNMAAAFKLSGIAAANQTDTNVVIADILSFLSLRVSKVEDGYDLI